VKKILTCLFISLYIIGTTELSQLLKIGYFIEHYIEHKSVNENLSLLEFIDIHYLQPTVIDDDYSEDMQLPFKTHNDCHSYSNYAADIKQEFSITTPLIEYSANHKAYINPNNISQYLDEIFQPPRIV
jgi:hypothetical protein